MHVGSVDSIVFVKPIPKNCLAIAVVSASKHTQALLQYGNNDSPINQTILGQVAVCCLALYKKGFYCFCHTYVDFYNNLPLLKMMHVNVKFGCNTHVVSVYSSIVCLVPHIRLSYATVLKQNCQLKKTVDFTVDIVLVYSYMYDISM